MGGSERALEHHQVRGHRRDDLGRLRQVVGRSATAVIAYTRLAEVKHYLARTDLGLRAIASRTGFCSLHHLSNAFRDRFGVSPGRYRQEMRM